MQPLVAPAAMLSNTERERYSRHTVMVGIGELGQRRLKNSRVLCVGAGGLGSPVLLYLAAAGVGTIGVIDDDTVSESNLQRQVLYTTQDVGQLKVDVAMSRISAMNPLITVVRHPERLTDANADQIVSGYDVVIDGADNFATRYLVNDACVRNGIPDVLGSVLQFQGQVSVFWSKAGPCYRCVFPNPPADAPSCADAGVFGALCGTVGGWMATEAIKLLTGHGSPLIGRLLTFDAALQATRHLVVQTDPQCATCQGVAREEMADSVIPSIKAVDVAAALATNEETAFRLIDIREPHEVREYAVPGAESIPQRDFLSRAMAGEFAHGVPLVLFCHAGVRSAHAVATLQELGHRDVRHIAGGIVEWIAEVDSPARD